MHELQCIAIISAPYFYVGEMNVKTFMSRYYDSPGVDALSEVKVKSAHVGHVMVQEDAAHAVAQGAAAAVAHVGQVDAHRRGHYSYVGHLLRSLRNKHRM